MRAVIKPFDPQADVFLFTSAAAYRTRYQAVSGRPDWPEYPPVGARIDDYLAGPSDVTLDILDAAGTVVRRYGTKTEAFTALAEQTRFALRVRDLLADARALAQRVRAAIESGRRSKRPRTRRFDYSIPIGPDERVPGEVRFEQRPRVIPIQE